MFSTEERKKWKQMSKRVSDLERKVQGQQIFIEILIEFAKSVANSEKKDLISYQQFHSPTADGCEHVRMLFDKLRELG